MLVIRNDQIRAIGAAGVARFEAKMVRHLQNVFPEWSQTLGLEKLAGFVRHGIQRANRYGFQVELDLARYLHAMQALGEGFDVSSEYPWAPELLNSRLPAAEKMNRLRDAVEYQREARRIRGAR